jgi:hypothetical protein
MKQPENTNAILGGQTSVPTNSVTLGGIEGLRQRFAIASPNQKLELLFQTLNYDDAGVELLIDALSDPSLWVRVGAYQLLAEIKSEKATTAMAKGFQLNPGDRLYHVHISLTDYSDQWLYLVDVFEEWKFANVPDEVLNSKPISSHFSKVKAEAEALFHHQQIAYDHGSYLSSYGYDEYSFREWFDLGQWVRDNNVFNRQSQESIWDFAERLRKFFQAIERPEQLAQLYQSLERQSFDLDQWMQTIVDTWIQTLSVNESDGFIRYDETYSEFEEVIVEFLRISERHDLLGKLWIQAAGHLAFVYEEVITEVKHLDIFQITDILQC